MFKRVVAGIFRHGRQAIEGVVKRPLARDALRRFTQLEVAQSRALQTSWSGKGQLSLFGRFVTRYTSQCIVPELRRRGALQFQAGSFPVFAGAYRARQRLPLFAFLSVGLAAGVGLQRCEQSRYDPICDQIKGLFLQRDDDDEEVSSLMSESVGGGGVADYKFGRLIAKGCHAAVYEASINHTSESIAEDASLDGVYSEDDTDSHMSGESLDSESGDVTSDTDSESFEAVDEDSDCESFVLISESGEETDDIGVTSEVTDQGRLDDVVAASATEVIAEDVSGRCHAEDVSMKSATLDDKFELAVKMMFNYGIESTAGAIVMAMERELLPAEVSTDDDAGGMWRNGRRPKKRLPPHPNIVRMVGSFIDDVPSLPGDVAEYPAALPTRLNPTGCGRNKTMFIVMKRYACTLREYLLSHHLNEHDATVLLAQLMEAVVHLVDNDIVHRDLKSDNVLLEENGQCPHLVVADFGSSFVAGSLGLRLWYPSDEINKGGNAALMAPEIISASAGLFSFLNYSKSDVWASGALAYEIFGCENPFYGRVVAHGKKLRNNDYTEQDLPDLPDWVSSHMNGLVKLMLQKDPSKRPGAALVADMLHVLLWGPEQWRAGLESGSPPPSRRDVIRWLLTLSAQVMCQRWSSPPAVEYRLKRQFLSRLDLDGVLSAVDRLWALA